MIAPLQLFTYADVTNCIFKLKNKEMRTNFFMPEGQFNTLRAQGKLSVFAGSDSLVMFAEDDGFLRLYFVVRNAGCLADVFDIAPDRQDDICVEAAGNSDYLLNVKSSFLSNGFHEYTSMVRMSKMRTETTEFDKSNIHRLTADKKVEIAGLYSRYFDKFVERIPTEEELDGIIAHESCWYYSDNNEIQGFIIFDIHGVTSHLKYWFVHPDYRDRKIGSKLIQLFFNTGEKVKRELFWVIASNENAIKRYKHFGFAEENMHNLILINKNIKYEEPNY